MEISLSLTDTFSHLCTTDAVTISSVVFPIDALAPPPVKSRASVRYAVKRSLLKKRSKTRRKSSSDGEDDIGFFGGGDGGFYGGFGGGGGRGWNFGGFGGGGGFNWDDWSSSSSHPDDPAFDFVYEVVCWVVFSNCLHFAFKKVVRLVTEEREKVPLRIAAVF